MNLIAPVSPVTFEVIPPPPTRTEPGSWDSAIAELRNALSDERVLFDHATREDYSLTTLPQGTIPNCVVYPVNRKEVQRIMHIASEHRLPWHAISRGKNWGYGDACAATDGQLIVDLRKMDRIVEVNEQLAYAVLEPGVTQGQLAAYLKSTGSRLMLDVTGAGPDASIVGNTLQRGFGHTPYGDHFAHSCNYEVVLPDGKLVHTGFGAIERSSIGHVYSYGLGPFDQGAYSQSHAGIVTRMTVWLMPRPQCVEGFAFRVMEPEALPDVIEILRELRQDEVVRSIVHLANDLRVISTQLPDAWRFCPDGPLPDQERRRLANQCGIGAWNAVGGLYGSTRSVAESKRVIKKALRDVATIAFFSRTKVKLLENVTSCFERFATGRRWKRIAHSVRDVFDLLEGNPTPSHLEGARWRVPQEVKDLRQFGLIWVAPVVPLASHAIEEAVGIIHRSFRKYQFDPLITISPITPRAAICIANVNFDKADRSLADRAQRCASQAKEELLARGYPSYRQSSIPLSESRDSQVVQIGSTKITTR